jgi:hypothetical protein
MEREKGDQNMDTRCSIAVHNKRTRFADADGISAKAVIDGLRIAKILPDDGPKFVKEVTFSQEKVGSKLFEQTIITITFPD